MASAQVGDFLPYRSAGESIAVRARVTLWSPRSEEPLPGKSRRESDVTKVRAGKFNREAAQKGYALNKMCYSLNSAANRETFAADEEGYCQRYGLGGAELAAVIARDKPRLFELGGNMYFLAKLDRVPKRQPQSAQEYH
jgi:protocatechuate 4,5-dioxygenase alpha chain